LEICSKNAPLSAANPCRGRILIPRGSDVIEEVLPLDSEGTARSRKNCQAICAPVGQPKSGVRRRDVFVAATGLLLIIGISIFGEAARLPKGYATEEPAPGGRIILDSLGRRRCKRPITDFDRPGKRVEMDLAAYLLGESQESAIVVNRALAEEGVPGLREEKALERNLDSVSKRGTVTLATDFEEGAKPGVHWLCSYTGP